MRPSQQQSRSNKELRFLIAILVAFFFFVPFASSQGTSAPGGAQHKRVTAKKAVTVPAVVPLVDSVPSVGHLNDPIEPAQTAASTDSVPPTSQINDEAVQAQIDTQSDGVPGAGHLIDNPAKGNLDQVVVDTLPSGSLQLDVLINGYAIDLIAAFVQLPGGGFSSARSELQQLGLKVSGKGNDSEQINLASIEGLNYEYDQDKQTINLKISDAGRETRSIAITPPREMLQAESDLGVVLNYTGYGAANYDLGLGASHFNGASVTLDARAFSKFGVVQQSGILGTTTFSDFTATRLDTNWTYANQERAETYTVGDIISGSLNWTRPVRFGGGQVQRNFGVRPDLITRPLPSLEGSAAVPSTVDVYVNGAKTYSSDISPGPFSIDHLPLLTGHGTARVVLTDTTGKQTESETQIYTSTSLLAPHLFDYSLDLGLPRRGYGTNNFDYDNQLMAIASARYGISNEITAEAHAEARLDMFEGGLGTSFVAGPFGVFNAAAATSYYQGDLGFYGFGSWDFEYKNLLVRASAARTFGNFVDLAAVTEIPIKGILHNGVPQALDQLTVSYGFPDWNLGTGLSLIHINTHEGVDSMIVGANVTKSFRGDISAYANAYIDLDNGTDYGAFVGLTVPFGKNISSSSGASIVKNNWEATTEVAKPLDTSYGSYGWRVSASAQDTYKRLAAEGSYRSDKAILSGRVSGENDRASASATIEGSLVATKSGLFMGNPIADSLAIVDAGVEGIDVSYENRFVGKTRKDGKLLISELRSYQRNKISIDPEKLPLNASVSETDKYIAPRTKSGVLVDFGVKKDGNGLIVVLTDAKGAFIPPGTTISVAGKSEPFLMGYDGEVYLTDIDTHVSLTAESANISCSANFDFQAEKETQTSIGPLQCL